MHFVFAGNGEPVVLLHGFPEHWYSWRYQLKALSDAGFTAVAPDLRGYGQTDKPARGYEIESLVADVEGLTSALGFKKFSVVGHDWGGPIAWHVAMHVAGVKGLAVVNGPHPAIFLRNLLTSRQFLKSWYMYVFQIPGVAERVLRREDYRAIKLMFKDGQRRAPDKINDEDISRLTDEMRKPRAIESGLEYYRRAFRNNPIRAWRRIKKVKAPTAVIWSTGDRALIPDTRKKLEAWVDARLDLHYIEGAGHWAPQERPDEVNEILVDFLQGL